MFSKIVSIIIIIYIFSIIQTGYAKEIYWEEYHISLSGITEEQLLVLEKTLNNLRFIEPKELKINKELYQRLSRFEELFGFPFNGNNIFHWLLSRVHKIKFGNSWTVAINQNKGEFLLGDDFFTRLSPLERLYTLIHEARHSDADGYEHVKCPKEFKFISAGQPEIILENELSCDKSKDGAYSFHAAFLFELFAYSIFDQKLTGLLYNSSIARVLP